MEEFTASLLRSIRESEAATLDKQRRLAAARARLQAVEAEVAREEKAAKGLQHQADMTRRSLYNKKADRDLVVLKLKSSEEQEEVVEARIEVAREEQERMVEEMAAMVDQVIASLLPPPQVCGAVATSLGEEEQLVGQVREEQRSGLVRELKQLEQVYRQAAQLSEAVVGLQAAEREGKAAAAELKEKKEVMELQKEESGQLMERVHQLNHLKLEAADSAAAREVRQLQKEISQLVQEGGWAVEVKAEPNTEP